MKEINNSDIDNISERNLPTLRKKINYYCLAIAFIYEIYV